MAIGVAAFIAIQAGLNEYQNQKNRESQNKNADKSRKAQQEAQDASIRFLEETLEKQLDIMNRNMATVHVNVKNLSDYLDDKNIEIEKELLAGNEDYSNELLTAVTNAYEYSKNGLEDQAEVILRSIKESTVKLKDGQSTAATSILQSLKSIEGYQTEGVQEAEKQLLAASDAATNTTLSGIAEAAEFRLNATRDSIKATEKGYANARDYQINALNQAQTSRLSGIDKAYATDKAYMNNAIAKYGSIKSEAKDSFSPWMQSGKWANDRLQADYESLTRSFTYDDFEKDGGYQLGLKEGQETIVNYGSALGVTSNVAKDLIKYSTDYGQTHFGTARDRFVSDQNRKINFLSGMSDRGLGATRSYVDVASSADTNAANALSNFGKRAAGYEYDKGNVIADTDLARGDANANYELNSAANFSQGYRDLGEIRARQSEDTASVTADNQRYTGEIKANTATELANIKSDAESQRGTTIANSSLAINELMANEIKAIARTEAANILAKSDLGANYESTIGQINSDKAKTDTGIAANKLAQDAANKTNTTNSLLSFYTNNNAQHSNLIGQQGANMANTAINQGNILAGYYQNMANINSNYYQNQQNNLDNTMNYAAYFYGKGGN